MAASKSKLKQRATVAELAQIIDRSEVVVRQIIGSLGLKRDKQLKYLVSAVVAEHIERQKRDPKVIKALSAELEEPTTWADKLKAKQVEKLDVQIDELRGNLVSIDDHRAALSEHAEITKGAFRNFIQTVSARFSDPQAVKIAETVTDSAMASIREKLENEHSQ